MVHFQRDEERSNGHLHIFSVQAKHFINDRCNRDRPNRAKLDILPVRITIRRIPAYDSTAKVDASEAALKNVADVESSAANFVATLPLLAVMH